MVLARMINWWMSCSFLLRLKGSKVYLFASQVRKIVCHGQMQNRVLFYHIKVYGLGS